MVGEEMSTAGSPPSRPSGPPGGGGWREAQRLSGQLSDLGLRPIQPEAHVHLAVHRCRRRQMLSGLPMPVGLQEELAQVEVAMGDERTHAEVAGQGQGLAIVAFRRLDSRRIATGDDFAEQAETPRLVAVLLVALRQGDGLLCTLQSIV